MPCEIHSVCIAKKMVAKGLNDKVAGSVIVVLPNDTTRSPDTLHKSKFILKRNSAATLFVFDANFGHDLLKQWTPSLDPLWMCKQ